MVRLTMNEMFITTAVVVCVLGMHVSTTVAKSLSPDAELAELRKLVDQLDDKLSEFESDEGLSSGKSTNLKGKKHHDDKCTDDVLSFEPPVDITKRGENIGSFSQDPYTDMVYFMPGTWANSLTEFPSMDAYINNTNSKRYTLPVSCGGGQSLVINRKLYCPESGLSNLLVYDLDDIKNYQRIQLTDGKPTRGNVYKCANRWGGFTSIDIAYDGDDLYVIWANYENECSFTIYMINEDNVIEQTWNTNISKADTQQAFLICRKLYVVKHVYEPTTISNIYDLDTGLTTMGDSLKFNSGHRFNSHTHYDVKEQVLYSWDAGFQVKIGVTFL